MAKLLFGISVNNESELKTALIKKEIGHLPNAEMDLFENQFVTQEKAKRGNLVINELFAGIDEEMVKDISHN